MDAHVGPWVGHTFEEVERNRFNNQLRYCRPDLNRLYDRAQSFAQEYPDEKQMTLLHVEQSIPPYVTPRYAAITAFDSISRILRIATLQTLLTSDNHSPAVIVVPGPLPPPAEVLALPQLKGLQHYTPELQARKAKGIGFIALYLKTATCSIGYANPFTGEQTQANTYDLETIAMRHKRLEKKVESIISIDRATLLVIPGIGPVL